VEGVGGFFPGVGLGGLGFACGIEDRGEATRDG
jgi:hypothetical protein